MAKKADGCSTLVGLGIVLLVLGNLANGGCSESKRAAVPSVAAYAPPTPSQPQLADLYARPPAPAMDKEGNPILNPERYVPKTIALSKQIKVWDGKSASGQKTVAAGAELPLKGIYGYQVMVEVEGRTELIPADSTNLLDQMVQATGDD